MNRKWNYYIDASTTNMGIVLCCEDTKEILITSLSFKKYRNKDKQTALSHYHKLSCIHGILQAFTQDFPPSLHIVMEGIFIQPRFKNSSEILLKLHGMLMTIFMGRNFSFIPPASVKKAITGRGDVPKSKVRETLEEKYGTEFKNEDESDAFALLVSDFIQNHKMIEEYDIKNVSYIEK